MVNYKHTVNMHQILNKIDLPHCYNYLNNSSNYKYNFVRSIRYERNSNTYSLKKREEQGLRDLGEN